MVLPTTEGDPNGLQRHAKWIPLLGGEQGRGELQLPRIRRGHGFSQVREPNHLLVPHP